MAGEGGQLRSYQETLESVLKLEGLEKKGNSEEAGVKPPLLYLFSLEMKIPWRSERTSKNHRFLKFIKKEAKKKKKPIFDSYKKVCGKIGDIDYLEFEYFYMEFYRNSEFKGTDYDGRFLVRQVSKSLRLVIDAQKPKKWDEIGFQEDLNGIQITLRILFSDEKYEIRFTEKKGGATVISGGNEIYLKGADHLALALNFLAPILSQRNREIGHSLKLSLENDPKIFDKFSKFIDFSSSTSKLAPRKLNIFDLQIVTKFEIPLAKFLSKIDPSEFSALEMKSPSCKLKIGNYEEILETEVFKNAEGVSLITCEPLNSMLIDKFLHLQYFQCHLKKISMSELSWLREKLSTLKHFKGCSIRVETPFDLNEVAAILDGEIQDDGRLLHDFDIAGSEFHLHFEFNSTRSLVFIEKLRNEQ
ncbi:hypothetical protein CAEBREN_14602 [Caenorhabditis brenneri]|uniref:DUF38 domain-containing protein n=1 Tax=Caenorhabditis brenneri TaxID=135651 RepID=G0MW05_CAEBE|nr:hypothetical protein CAEBREN_14602 [Caenorhabditis brenneri]